jgi:hypothetical protein
MPSSDPHPLAERELAWLLHSAVAWALTGALILVADRPLWDAVGVVLLALGLGLIGWVLQRRRHQSPRQLANWIFRYLSAKPQGPPRREGGRHERVRVRPASGAATPRDRPAFGVARRGDDPAQADASLPQRIALVEDAGRAPATLQREGINLQQHTLRLLTSLVRRLPRSSRKRAGGASSL